MDQSQQAAVLTAGLLFFMVTIVFLIARFNIKTRRTWLALDSTQQRLIMTCTAGFVLWVLSAKAVRPWASAVGFEHHWSLDVAPSLTAGITVTGYVAFLLTIFHRLKILSVFLIGAALMLLFEVIQIWLSDYVFDSLDVLAGTIGAAVVTLVLLRDSRACG